MSVHIDRQNYEEFYLDYLEGNLSGDVLAAFEAFLDANPDLLVDEDFSVLLPPDETLDPVVKLALKQTPDMTELSAETLDYFLIARQEGLLTGEQSAQLDHWLQANAQYRNDARLMQLIKLAPAVTDVYTAKSQLKRPAGRVIPFTIWIGTAAAAAGMAFFLLFSDGTPDNPVGPVNPVAQNDPQKINDDQGGTPDTRQTSSSTTGDRAEYTAVVSQHAKQTAAQPPTVVDQLALRPVAENGNTNNSLVPLHIDKPVEGNLPTHLQDMAVVSTPVTAQAEMANPIVPITNRLSAALNTEVDFRTAKAAKGSNGTKGGGFFLKIGKFEVSHRSASR